VQKRNVKRLQDQVAIAEVKAKRQLVAAQRDVDRAKRRRAIAKEHANDALRQLHAAQRQIQEFPTTLNKLREEISKYKDLAETYRAGVSLIKYAFDCD
jgi:predicted  nucleic acid-binding Zn-ribbon protein